MANVSVTITKAGRCDDYGAPLVVGQVYSTSFDEARALWQAGFASVTDEAVFDNDSLPNSVIATSVRFAGFRPSLLASLAANSTASRSNGVVTIAATGHGITTGTTYVGFRFYYPGSTSIAAGWYDKILTIPDANTITFSAAGADFASESINSGSAWTTGTDVISMVIPGNTLRDQSKLTVWSLREGTNSANAKTQAITFGGSQITTYQLTTSPKMESAQSFRCQGKNKQIACTNVPEGTSGTALTTLTKDVTADQTLVIKQTLAAASEFIVINAAHVEIIQ